MNHKEMFEQLLEGKTLIDSQGEMIKMVDDHIKFLNTKIGEAFVVLNKDNSWSIYEEPRTTEDRLEDMMIQFLDSIVLKRLLKKHLKLGEVK